MNREEMAVRLEEKSTLWDFIVIGGGATGLGVAIDAATRGYKTLLLEQSDFAKGTSSRSTKLIHGGVRYLRQGNLSLVLESLKERGLLRQNAPHLVRKLPFVIPTYAWWEAPFYGFGLRLYDLLAGRRRFGLSKHLNREETLKRLPTIKTEGLRGGVLYFDGQFDDARLAINMAETAAEHGATVLNYIRVDQLLSDGETISGLIAQDTESRIEYRLKAKVVVNATGVFADSLRKMDDPEAGPMISPSQGIHIVLDRSFHPSDTAIMIPYTDDGRVLFAIPWHGRTVVGTTDTPVSEAVLDPKPLDQEIEYLLTYTARFLTKAPGPSDVKSAYAGLRPLVTRRGAKNTAALSRDHTIQISRTGLVTVTGGKWTTYRRMAEDTVTQASKVARLSERPCATETLPIHGYDEDPDRHGDLSVYGADAPNLQATLREDPTYCERLNPGLPVRRGEIVWSVRHEMARTVEDFLARRTRTLLLDARDSIEMAPQVAETMGAALGKDRDWINQQVKEYRQLAAGYLLAQR